MTKAEIINDLNYVLFCIEDIVSEETYQTLENAIAELEKEEE